MGRPREHDERVQGALLAAAEELLTEAGEAAISVRAVADRVGTSTRAVYSVFGSKEGLLFALAEHGFELLGAMVEALPVTDDPVADVVSAAMDGFRRWTLTHPALYRLTFDRFLVGPRRNRRVSSAGEAALEKLRARVRRACEAGLLGERSVDQVILQVDALCEGIATVELRGMLYKVDAEALARDALESLLQGMGALPAPAPKAGTPAGKPRGRP
jgi:AcrR family transcriptional regulator